MRILMAGTGSGGDRNFEDTVLAQVDLEQYAGSLTADERQFLARFHGQFGSVWAFPCRSTAGLLPRRTCSHVIKSDSTKAGLSTT
jgi:hypothetical protein